MPYIQRDPRGAISALTREADPSSEFLPADDPAIVEFMRNPADSSDKAVPDIVISLQQADLELIRVIEDLIDLLESKNVLMFSELPLPVQQKLLKKRGHRQRLQGVGGGLLTPEDDIL